MATITEAIVVPSHSEINGHTEQQEDLPDYDVSQTAEAEALRAAERSSALDRRLLKVWNTRVGYDITDADEHQLYYLRHYQVVETPDLIIYGGYAREIRLGHVQFVKYAKDFGIYMGGAEHPADEDYDLVRYAPGTGFLRGPSYRFEVDVHEPRDGEPRRRRLHWRRTKETLRATLFPTRDFTLYDEATGETVAVYTEKSFEGNGKLKGTMELKQPLTEEVQIFAMLVVISVLEKLRRQVSLGARQGAIPGQAGWNHRSKK